jgi:hypothetical protein
VTVRRKSAQTAHQIPNISLGTLPFDSEMAHRTENLRNLLDILHSTHLSNDLDKLPPELHFPLLHNVVVLGLVQQAKPEVPLRTLPTAVAFAVKSAVEQVQTLTYLHQDIPLLRTSGVQISKPVEKELLIYTSAFVSSDDLDAYNFSCTGLIRINLYCLQDGHEFYEQFSSLPRTPPTHPVLQAMFTGMGWMLDAAKEALAETRPEYAILVLLQTQQVLRKSQAAGAHQWVLNPSFFESVHADATLDALQQTSHTNAVLPPLAFDQTPPQWKQVNGHAALSSVASSQEPGASARKLPSVRRMPSMSSLLRDFDSEQSSSSESDEDVVGSTSRPSIVSPRSNSPRFSAPANDIVSGEGDLHRIKVDLHEVLQIMQEEREERRQQRHARASALAPSVTAARGDRRRRSETTTHTHGADEDDADEPGARRRRLAQSSNGEALYATAGASSESASAAAAAASSSVESENVEPMFEEEQEVWTYANSTQEDILMIPPGAQRVLFKLLPHSQRNPVMWKLVSMNPPESESGSTLPPGQLPGMSLEAAVTYALEWCSERMEAVHQRLQLRAKSFLQLVTSDPSLRACEPKQTENTAMQALGDTLRILDSTRTYEEAARLCLATRAAQHAYVVDNNAMMQLDSRVINVWPQHTVVLTQWMQRLYYHLKYEFNDVSRTINLFCQYMCCHFPLHFVTLCGPVYYDHREEGLWTYYLERPQHAPGRRGLSTCLPSLLCVFSVMAYPSSLTSEVHPLIEFKALKDGPEFATSRIVRAISQFPLWWTTERNRTTTQPFEQYEKTLRELDTEWVAVLRQCSISEMLDVLMDELEVVRFTDSPFLLVMDDIKYKIASFMRPVVRMSAGPHGRPRVVGFYAKGRRPLDGQLFPGQDQETTLEMLRVGSYKVSLCPPDIATSFLEHLARIDESAISQHDPRTSLHPLHPGEMFAKNVLHGKYVMYRDDDEAAAQLALMNNSLRYDDIGEDEEEDEDINYVADRPDPRRFTDAELEEEANFTSNSESSSSEEDEEEEENEDEDIRQYSPNPYADSGSE